MNDKDIAKIRRRFHTEKSNISRICGCYVNENRDIISTFNQSLGLMSEDESEQMLALLKKTLSGTLGKQLYPVDFSTKQATEGEEHKLLSTLRNSSLEDKEALQEFYQKVIASLQIEGNYMIVLATEACDVFGTSAEESESFGVYRYILCAICPLSSSKVTMAYDLEKKALCKVPTATLIASPAVGFLFPAFEDGGANIYQTLFYAKDTKNNHPEFVEGMFKSTLPMPATRQKEIFEEIIGDTLEKDNSLEVMQKMHLGIASMVEEHKESKNPEPLVFSCELLKNILSECGAKEERLDTFEEKFATAFGQGTELPPKNIIDTKRYDLRLPEVVVKVPLEYGDLLETREINGTHYLLIRATTDIEVNGVKIHFPKTEKEDE